MRASKKKTLEDPRATIKMRRGSRIIGRWLVAAAATLGFISFVYVLYHVVVDLLL